MFFQETLTILGLQAKFHISKIYSKEDVVSAIEETFHVSSQEPAFNFFKMLKISTACVNIYIGVTINHF